MIESKAVIDRFVLDRCRIDSVDSLQVCGLEVHFGNVTLAEPGLYVGNQLYTFNIDKLLSKLPRYFNLVLHLLFFGDQCVSIANQYEAHLNSVCGSWNPPRTTKTQPPPSPANLFGTAE